MRRHSLEMLETMYRREYPDLTVQELREKADKLRKQLISMNAALRRNNRRFYRQHDLYGI